MSTAASYAKRIAELQQELEELRVPAKPSSQDGLRDELKRKKGMFLAAQAQYAHERRQAGMADEPISAAAAQAAKEKAHDMQKEVERAIEAHSAAQREFEALRATVGSSRDTCEKQLAVLYGDVPATDHNPGLFSAAARGEKRQRLEEELQALHATRSNIDYAQLEEAVTIEIAKLEALASQRDELGFPIIEFHDDRKEVVLSAPGGIDARLKTVVKVETEPSGRLLSAEPDQRLGLWNEVKAAVENNDLAWLLTLVWDKLCEQQQESSAHSARGRSRPFVSRLNLPPAGAVAGA